MEQDEKQEFVKKYVTKCFEDYMSDKLVHHTKYVKKNVDRTAVRSMTPESKKEYIRKKNREHKAASRQRQRDEQKKTLQESSFLIDDMTLPLSMTLCERSNLSGEYLDKPGEFYIYTENFLKEISKRNSQFEWFMNHDPRTRELITKSICEIYKS